MTVEKSRVRPVFRPGEPLPAPRQELLGGFVASHHFTLCGVPVIADFRNPELADRVLGLWARLLALLPGEGSDHTAADLVRLQVLKGFERAPRPAYRPHFTSPVLSVWRTDTGFHLFSGDSSIVLDTISGTATAHIVDTFWTSPLAHQRELFLISMLMLLQPKGVHGLHAVGLVNSDVGVLIVGDSGSGKTTTGLALIRNGWSYLSDDAIGLRGVPGTNEVAAMALRRGFSCTRESWTALGTDTPADRDGYPLERDKWLIEMSDFFPAQQAYDCVPRVIAFPVISNQRWSSIRLLNDDEGLLRLLPQSAGITARLEYAQHQMTMLGKLAQQVRFCEFGAGRDVFDDPDRVSELFMDVAGGVR